MSFPEDDDYIELRHASYVYAINMSHRRSLNIVNSAEHMENYVNLQRTGTTNADFAPTKFYSGKISAEPGL